MKYTVAEIEELIATARAANLEGVELLNGDPEAIAAKYNGIGPGEWPEKWRRAITRCFNLFQPAALIHDLRFTYASGWAANYSGLFGNHANGKGISGGQYEGGTVKFNLYEPLAVLYETQSSTFSNGRKYTITQCASNTSGTAVTYKDGVAVSSKTSVDVLLTYGSALTYIGAAHGDVGRSYNGTIHFLRVYNRPLTSAEVARNRIIDINRYNLPT